MAQDETPQMIRGAEYEIGRLHGRLVALECRVDRGEAILATIDSKIDAILLALATATGGKKTLGSFAKWVLGILTAAASVAGVVFTALHIGAK